MLIGKWKLTCLTAVAIWWLLLVAAVAVAVAAAVVAADRVDS